MVFSLPAASAARFNIMMQRNLGACSKRELAALFVMFCFRRFQIPFAPKSADHGVRFSKLTLEKENAHA